MREFFLHSARIGFCTWLRSDLPLARNLWADPAVTRYISKNGFTESEIAARLAREIDSQSGSRIQYWPIFLLSDGSFIGCCGLRPRPAQPSTPEFGVHIISARWRNGYALEAANRVIEYAFEYLQFDSLFAGHHPANLASRALLLRIGFQHTHDELYVPTGLAHPSYVLCSSQYKTA